MSVPPTSSSSTTYPPILSQVGSTSESMLSAAPAMMSSLANTSAVSSASQFSAETLLAMLERKAPSTSLSQPVEVIPETQNYSRDFEVIIPSEDATVTSKPFVRLCDPAAITLPLHSTPLEPSSTREITARFGTQYVSPVSGHSPDPPVFSPQQLPCNLSSTSILESKKDNCTILHNVTVR